MVIYPILSRMADSKIRRVPLAFGSEPINEHGGEGCFIGMPRNERDISRPTNLNIGQRRHQPAGGDIDFQHRQGTDPDSKTVLNRLSRDEEVIEHLPGKLAQTRQACGIKPIAGTRLARQQRMAFNICRLADRTL